MKLRYIIVIAFLALLAATTVHAAFRFPMPEFETGYEVPSVVVPEPVKRFNALDVAVLFICLSLSTWFILKKRSRRAIFALAIFSIIYFGFWRKGCICAVGSLQNVALATFDANTGVSLTVLAFFLMPLIFALFFGRVFCASVCPLGAVQDVAAIRPVEIPKPIDRLLGIFPYIYLGLTILSVATGAGFLICRYDPYIGFFRQGASLNMLVAGGSLLAVGIFIGRPYCRYLCPYGVLLGWMSRFSMRNVTITPTDCIQCRLCEDSCPYGAINAPIPEELPESPSKGRRRIGILILLLPLIVAAFTITAVLMHNVLSNLHPMVQLAERIAEEDKGYHEKPSVESEAFRKGTKKTEDLYKEVQLIREEFKFGSAFLGAFIGLVISFKLIGFSMIRKRSDYEADKSMCLSCGRCYAYCPVEDDINKKP